MVVTSYLMNPAEDIILYSDDLREGMWVLAESRTARAGAEASEDVRLRAQRFCRVTRLGRSPAYNATPEQVTFIGEWVDGYQESRSTHVGFTWIVKKNSIPTGQEES